MKQIIYGHILLLLFFLISCNKDNNGTEDFAFRYITDVEVLSTPVEQISIDHFRKLIELKFREDQDLSKVTLQFSLADEVKMVDPPTNKADFDLTKESSVQIKKNGKTVQYKIKIITVAADLSLPSSWEKQDGFGQLPPYLSVYKYNGKISSKQLKAFVAVAKVGSKGGKFKILGEKKGYKTPDTFYKQNFNPPVIVNGGYFWDGTSLNLLIKNGVTVSTSEPMVRRKYQGGDAYYYPTLGAFGLEKDGTFSAQWVYHSNNTLYAYPQPSPNVAGEKPQPKPSATFPSGAFEWKPTEAIGAGPILIKEGEYKNLWENEMYDVESGVGPEYNNPRSAVGYHPKGYVVFFVCEGRNKTPNTPGLTLREVANLLLELGCTEAINLDGGGSSCMLVNGKETIIPSDKNGQRAVTTALAIY